MAINKLLIKESLKQLANELKEYEDQGEAIDKWSDELTNIITDAILSADVIGISTTVVGTSPSGPVSGVGTQSNIGKLQ